LVKAQCVIATKLGVERIKEVVTNINPNDSGCGTFKLSMESGFCIYGKKVVLATGAFSNFYNLLPNKINATPVKQTIVLMELGTSDIQRLSGMPSIIFKGQSQLDFCYILPPILYPDGKYYLKIGHGGAFEDPLHSFDQVQSWYHGNGSTEAVNKLLSLVSEIVPGIKPVSTKVDVCALYTTSTGHLFIGMVSNQLGLVTGGNGYAAKSSDEIGRVAANMIISEQQWDYHIPANEFRIEYLSKQ